MIARTNLIVIVCAGLLAVVAGCRGHATSVPATDLRGTVDLGLVIERADGAVLVIDTTARAVRCRVDGLGDLSHASVVFDRSGRYGFVFGRDGGLTKVDLLGCRVAARIVQAGNSIGGAITQNGRVVAVSNYDPGGVNLFAADDLTPLASIPATTAGGERSKVVGLVDAPQHRLVFALWDTNEIWIADVRNPRAPQVQRYRDVGSKPYDALITPDGRHYLAGLFGEDGLVQLDLWHPDRGTSKVLSDYGRGERRLPVYKMPHLEGWAAAGAQLFVPAVGRHEVLVVNRATWTEAGRIAVAGQPIFVVARPDGRRVWVNFAMPDNDRVQVIDTERREVVRTLQPGKAVLHMEFTPRGEAVWVSARDDNRIVVYDTETFAVLARLPARHPSGVFFAARAARTGL